ncbi:MAG: hypothetical protein WD708_09140 [Kiritimatiellia bacterium]
MDARQPWLCCMWDGEMRHKRNVTQDPVAVVSASGQGGDGVGIACAHHHFHGEILKGNGGVFILGGGLKSLSLQNGVHALDGGDADLRVGGHGRI